VFCENLTAFPGVPNCARKIAVTLEKQGAGVNFPCKMPIPAKAFWAKGFTRKGINAKQHKHYSLISNE
jgi:hypothetical protein